MSEKDFSEGDLEKCHSPDPQAGDRALTIVETRDAREREARKRDLRFTRTNSVSLLNGPARPATDVVVPAVYRTLTIHLTETREGRPIPLDKGKVKSATDALAELDWHAVTADETCQRLGVAPSIGLDSAMVQKRQTQYGRNVIKQKKINWPLKVFWWIFGGFGALLTGAAVLVFISWKPLGNPDPSPANLALAVVLCIVVGTSALFNAVQDWSTMRVMASIGSLVQSSCLVQRDGVTSEQDSAVLVPGDIIQIRLGQKLPADCRILDCTADMKLDKSILTGESEPVSCSSQPFPDTTFMEAKNIGLQGSLCVSGGCRAVVVLTGGRTVFGRIADLTLGRGNGPTTLQREINRFVLIIASLAVIVALIVLIAWAAWLRPTYPDFINVPNWLVDEISVLVAFIPEGLPIAVTTTLTIIASRLRDSRILCKSLKTVETLGCISVICSDKTGTLTQNRMSVKETAMLDGVFRVDDFAKEKPKMALLGLAAIAGICNDAQYDAASHPAPAIIAEKERPERKVIGDATDTGLLRFSDSVLPIDQTRAPWVEATRIAFNSKNKFALKMVKLADADGAKVLPLLEGDTFNGKTDHLVLIKGGPDVLLPRCSSIMDSDSVIHALDESATLAICKHQADLAGQGRRVVLVARRLIDSSVYAGGLADQALADAALSFAKDLTVVGLLAIVDPPKHDTAHTVARCRQAGIRFCMVTGDFALTAAAISKEVGIFTAQRIETVADLDRNIDVKSVLPYKRPSGDDAHRPLRALVLSGSDLLTMNDTQWKLALAYDEITFARTTPEQKLRIVRAFQAEGCVVAVTGDGVNDAPALKQADVGVAVAGGSEVATEAADLVLLEDFSAIVRGIELGRLVFENLKKVVELLLSAGSFSELWPVLLSVFLGLPQALSSFQMIVICVFTDLFPAISMVYEPPETDLLNRPPRNIKTDRLADWRLLMQSYCFVGILESLTSMIAAFYWGFQRHGFPFSSIVLGYTASDSSDAFQEATNLAQSLYFYNLVIMQIFHAQCTRNRKSSIFYNPPWRNWRLLAAYPVSIGLACLISYVGWFHTIFYTSGVPIYGWFLPVAYGIGLLTLDELRKLYVRNNPGSLLARMAW